MRRLLLATLPLAGCFITPDHDPAPLASMTRTSVAVDASNAAKRIDPGSVTPAIAIRLDTKAIGNEGDPGDCPTIANDAIAVFDGQLLTLEDAGGWDAPIDGSSLCHAIQWSLATAPIGAPSQLEIADVSTTWTVATPDLLAADFATVATPPPGHVQIAWANAAAIEGAYVQFTDAAGTLVFAGAVDGYPGGVAVAVAGNVIDVTLPPGATGSGTLSINAWRTPSASCTGPAECTLAVTAGADLAMTLGT